MAKRTTCVSWSSYADFINSFPHYPAIADRLFLVDGPRITCAGGAGAAAALASHIIQKHVGAATARRVSHLLNFERIQSGDDIQPHPQLFGMVKNIHLRRCLLFMEQNLSQRLSMDVIARQLMISTRQLERLCRQHLGLTPAGLYEQLRMNYALWLVENTERAISEISADAGFADGSSFRRRFRSIHGRTPKQYRREPAAVKTRDSVGTRVFG